MVTIIALIFRAVSILAVSLPYLLLFNFTIGKAKTLEKFNRKNENIMKTSEKMFFSSKRLPRTVVIWWSLQME